MQSATSETESKSLDLSICVHHYTLRAPCPKGQGTKKITSQTWARLDVSGGGPLLWHASILADVLHTIFMTARSSRNCLQATYHAFHWLSWSEQGTRGWPSALERLQTGLFGVALPFKLQKKGDPARPPRDALTD